MKRKAAYIFNALPYPGYLKAKMTQCQKASHHRMVSTDRLGNINFWFVLIVVQVRKCQIKFVGPYINSARAQGSESVCVKLPNCMLLRKLLISL